MTLPLSSSKWIEIYFLKNFFLPYPARPIKPEPRRSIAAGSVFAYSRYAPLSALVAYFAKWAR